MNQEQYTLREIIQQRFEELDAHISALDAVTVKNDIPSFLNTYGGLKSRYELEALGEGLKELEDRLVAIEGYQSVQKFAIRQIVTVLFTTLLIAMGYTISLFFSVNISNRLGWFSRD